VLSIEGSIEALGFLVVSVVVVVVVEVSQPTSANKQMHPRATDSFFMDSGVAKTCALVTPPEPSRCRKLTAQLAVTRLATMRLRHPTFHRIFGAADTIAARLDFRWDNALRDFQIQLESRVSRSAATDPRL
jgi:hypothetical protein